MSKVSRAAVTALAAMLCLASNPGSTLAQTRQGTAAEQEIDHPRVLALLVASTDYSQARGVRPDNMPTAVADVALMASVLTQRDVPAQNIRILTDAPIPRVRGLPAALAQPSGAPTYLGITDNLEQIAAMARAGDQIVLHFSGHGEQHISTDSPSIEPDGLDEVFLPSDVERRDGRFVNGITDNILGEFIKQMRSKGADVILIADFCHSDGASRSGSGQAARVADDVRLGAGETNPETAAAQQVGRFAAFYAAPSLSYAKSAFVPYWVSQDRQQPQGALTYYLATALRDPRVTTVGQLQRLVERSLLTHAALEVADGLRPPPPQFEGPADMPLPGGQRATDSLTRDLWTVVKPPSEAVDDRVSVTSLQLPAGYLQGVRQGAVYRLSSIAAGGRESLVLYGRVSSVTADSATIVPHSMAGAPASRWSDLRGLANEPLVQAWSFIAELALAARLDAISIALPLPSETAPPALVRALDRVESRLGSIVENRGGQVTLVPAGSPATMRLRWAGSDLVLEESAGMLDGQARWVPIARLQGDTAVPTDQTGQPRNFFVDRIARGLVAAGNFLRVRDTLDSATSLGASSTETAQTGVVVQAFVLRSSMSEVSLDGSCVDPAQTWTAGMPVPAGAQSVDMSLLQEPGTIRRCDRLFVQVSMTRSDAVAASIALALQGPQGSLPESWRELCQRGEGDAGRSPVVAAACDQPVDVALIAFKPDRSIRAISADGAAAGSTVRLRAGAPALTYSLLIDAEVPQGGLRRVDLALLVSRPDPTSAVPTSFDRFCQTSVQSRFNGDQPTGPGGLAHTCAGSAGGALRSGEGQRGASVPDPLTDWLWSDAETAPGGTRSGSPAAIGAARTLVFRFGADVATRRIDEPGARTGR